MIKHFISVVIPAYNEEKGIADCLQSVKNQTYPEYKYEIIVVDNNSTDKTPEIAEKFGARVVGCQVQGVSASRQVGGKAAFGKIIVGTDADTLVARNWLELINENFQNEAIVGITGTAVFGSTSTFNKILAKVGFPLIIRLMFLFGKPALNGFNFAIRKDIFDKIGGFNPKLASAEDVDLGIRAGKVGKVLFVPNLSVETSARRIDKSRFKFFAHHVKNFVRFAILKKEPEGFETIR
jgi:glycosyltransferase involved in cell wall biosynthesis